ncbi:MAG: 4-hydroxybenzoate octaprenyltransferase [Rhizobiales bacterium]|nr:4-hydroxybenzoate octaprenyltransferase [Hyphomicrobiales bacterium]
MTNGSDERVADAVKGHWVHTVLPRAARPYAQLARFDRPIGWWLLLLPCWWSTALAAVAANSGSLNLFHILLFVIGAVVMRGAGCTYNDIVDRDIDQAVARTRSRPIPSGRVSIARAIAFMVVLCLIGLAVLLQFNLFTVFLGIGSLGFVAIYPFMKRITNWPQLALGLAFSWGGLVGWAAHFGSLSPASLALYGGAILWTIGYDTIYAHQDREDDALIGVKSTARLFGERTKPWLILFYAGATALFAFSFLSAGAGWVSFAGLALGAGHMIYQVIRLDIHNADQCLVMFRSNRDYGLILFAGLTLDTLV